MAGGICNPACELFLGGGTTDPNRLHNKPNHQLVKRIADRATRTHGRRRVLNGLPVMVQCGFTTEKPTHQIIRLKADGFVKNARTI